MCKFPCSFPSLHGRIARTQFNPEPQRTKLRKQHMVEFETLLEGSRNTLLVCHVRCLELANPCSFSDDPLVQTVCHEGRVSHSTFFSRRAYQDQSKARAKHVFSMKSNMTHARQSFASPLHICHWPEAIRKISVQASVAVGVLVPPNSGSLRPLKHVQGESAHSIQ